MMYVLLLICVHGAQGCNYDGGTIVGDFATRSTVVAYQTLEACEKEAKEFSDRYDDPDLFGVCRRVEALKP